MEKLTELMELEEENRRLAEKFNRANNLHQEHKSEVETLRDKLSKAKFENEQLDAKQRRQRKELEDMKGNIRVFARCRPMSQSELERENCDHVRVAVNC